MSVTLAFRFPAGRYHATPWGHHVNEGLIEWPPSPWRLLRALVSVGYTSGLWNDSGLPYEARRLIETLAAELPGYHLPSAVGAHSRHYMPTGVIDKDREKTTLVFDTWIQINRQGPIEDQELMVSWGNVDLDQDQLPVLCSLVDRPGYLGRSESWVTGRILPSDEILPVLNCFPEPLHSGVPDSGWEQVPLLAAVEATEYDQWRREHVAAIPPLSGGKQPRGKLLQSRDKAADPFPAHLLDCLRQDTRWLRQHGWSQPPGSRRVFYWRRRDAIEVGAPRPKSQQRSIQPVNAMLLSMTNSSRNIHALPPVIRTLRQAEHFHRTLIRIAAKNGSPPRVLTGSDHNRLPLRGAHRHAHVNPLDLNGDGHLDHILIWAPMGLDHKAQAAVRATRKTVMKGGIEPLRLAVAATGTLDGMKDLPGKYGQVISGITRCGALSWRSVTPFVAPR